MQKECKYHLLTFVTKYSRVPNEEIALKRYNTMMDIGKEPIILDSKGCELVGKALDEEAKKLGIGIIAYNILPDHVHVIIDSDEKSISEIIKKLKGYSAHEYNHLLERSGPLWAAGYSDTFLDTEEHFHRAIEYVENNHLKHQDRRGVEGPNCVYSSSPH